MDNFKEFFSEIPAEIKKGLSIALVIILLFSSGNILGSVLYTDKNLQDAYASGSEVTEDAAATQPPVTDTTAPTTPSTQPPATTPNANAGTSDTSTTAPAASDTATTAAPAGAAPQTKAEILALYNESANKVKTNATSVTRNYEDMRHNTEKLELPSLLQSTGESLISQFLKKNETPETYSGNADIIAKFPLPGETWVSKLTEADIAEATCTDNGTEYEIMLKAVTQADAAVGSGVGAGFEVIKTEDVMNAAGFIVKSFNTEYYDCVVKCKIDKATGNMTWANFTTPIVMKVQAKIGINAQVGMTFEKDYTIAY